MKYFSAVVLALALSVGAFAQRGAGRGGRGVRPVAPPLRVGGVIPFRTFGSPTGFPNILFPGTGNQPPIISPFTFPSTFATRLGATISGFPGFTGAPSRGFGDFGPGNFGAFGGGNAFPFPVVVGGDNGGYPPAAPNVTIVMPPQYAGGQPSSPVTINQNFGQLTAPGTTAEAALPESSGITMYQAPSAATAAPARDEQPIFLIALKDNTVYPAIGYWVESDALHYITPQGKHNQVSLGLVDRNISQRLNEGRKIDFHLPAGK